MVEEEKTTPKKEEAPKTEEPKMDSKDIEENKTISILSYIGILCLIPLLAKKDSAYAQYHAKQGLILFLAEIATVVIAWIPVIGWIVGFIAWIIWLILSIVGIINAASGKVKELPILGNLGKKVKI